jgi:hypothetical protein
MVSGLDTVNATATALGPDLRRNALRGFIK